MFECKWLRMFCMQSCVYVKWLCVFFMSCVNDVTWFIFGRVLFVGRKSKYQFSLKLLCTEFNLFEIVSAEIILMCHFHQNLIMFPSNASPFTVSQWVKRKYCKWQNLLVKCPFLSSSNRIPCHMNVEWVKFLMVAQNRFETERVFWGLFISVRFEMVRNHF